MAEKKQEQKADNQQNEKHGIELAVSNYLFMLLGVAAIIGLIYIPLEYRVQMLIVAVPVLAVLSIVGVVIYKFSKKFDLTKTDSEVSESKKQIITQVPVNHRWVLRNVWWSSPIFKGTDVGYTGYKAKKEGWRFWIPKIFHSDEGFVDLKPVQMDTDPFTVNCIDGNDVDVDARVTYYVKQDDIAPINYVLNARNVDCNDLVAQRVRVALNRAMNFTSKEVIEWGTREKELYSIACSEKANVLLKNDGATLVASGVEDQPEERDDNDDIVKKATYKKDVYLHDGKNYGIECIINIENVVPAPAIKAAMDRQAAAKIEEDFAKYEAAAMKTVIETGANPTWVMLSQTITDGLRTIFGKERKNKK